MRVCFFLFLLLSVKVFGQLSPVELHAIDSLKKVIASGVHDTIKIDAHREWDNLIYVFDPELDRKLNEKIEEMCLGNLKRATTTVAERKCYKRYLRTAYNNLGIILKRQGELNKALEYYTKSLRLYTEENKTSGMLAAYINISLLYLDQGKIKDAIESQIKGLELAEQTGDKIAEASALGNIGLIYYGQNDNAKALDYYNKSLKLFTVLKDTFGIASEIDNIGNIYNRKAQYDIAMEYYNRSYKLHEKIGFKKGAANCLNNIGSIYNNKKNHEKAKEYFLRSSKIQEELNDRVGASLSLTNLGSAYLETNDISNAIRYAQKALIAGQEAQAVLQIRDASKILWQAFKKLNKTKEALEMHELFMLMKDSVVSSEGQREVLKQEMQHTYEKQKALDDLAFEKEISVSEQKTKNQRIISWAVALGLLLVLIFAFFVINRLRITRKQKMLIEKQKHLIEEKHKEITDSINYAERIQRSFIATKQILDENLNDYFVLFKPKDVVSGDFYWASQLNHGNFALATADSTGHGVPGAIMSLLNITSLEKAIEIETHPSEILNATRKIIITRLKKDGSDEGGKDGMDCSLISFDFINKKIWVAAANNPVWIVRGAETIEVKPDKMPVGKHDRQDNSFTLHEMDLQTGDVIYALTDGFPDQFGGPQGKKFMSKNLRELIGKNAHLPMQEQKSFLESTFKNWVGDLEQVDDVTIIGVRV